MRIVHSGRPRTRADLLRQVTVNGVLFCGAVWILVRGLQAGAFSLRAATVEAGSPFYPVLAVVIVLLALLIGGLWAEAITALTTGTWKTAPGRDTEES